MIAKTLIFRVTFRLLAFFSFLMETAMVFKDNLHLKIILEFEQFRMLRIAFLQFIQYFLALCKFTVLIMLVSILGNRDHSKDRLDLRFYLIFH